MKEYYVVYESENGKSAMSGHADKLSAEVINAWRRDLKKHNNIKNCLITFIQELEREDDGA